jgi:TonB-linked SusC/RagA family outer membrane protein
MSLSMFNPERWAGARLSWPTALMAALVALSVALDPAVAQAQTGTITGQVTSQTGEPVAGAQVMIVGTQRGTLTNPRGGFLFTGVPAGDRQVRVVSLGYRSETQTVRVPADGTATVEFQLALSAIALDEIVVTGTVGGTERRAIGNVVSNIRATDVLEVAPIRDIQTLINARAPGVVITPGTGQVGSGSQIRIRGSSSVSLNNTPLLYVDGVRVNNAQNSGPNVQAFSSQVISRLNDFNPDDIESIEIIKGPAAATLYGTEAANGVIQIITKRGSEGRPTWNLSVRQGANWFQNAEGRVPTNYWRLNTTGTRTGEVQSINLVRTERERGFPLWRNGHIQNYNLSLSGGTADVRYHISGYMDREEGPDWDNELRRGGARANISVMATPTIEIGGNMGYLSSRTDLACEGGCGGVTWASYFSSPFHFGTNDPGRVQMADGTDRRRGSRSFAPEYYWDAQEYFQEVGRFTGSVHVNHRPADWFQHRVTFGMDRTNENDQWILPISDIYREWAPTGTGGKDVDRTEITFQTLDYSGTVSVPVTEGLTSNTSVGAQYYRRHEQFVAASGRQYELARLRTVSAAGSRSGTERFEEIISLGLFGQQSFNWQDRLFFTLGLRADDHSAFGENFSMVYYPKASAAWVVTEEPLWASVPGGYVVSDLRLRGAFGRAGEQPGAFAARSTYLAVPGEGGATVTPGSPGNPDLGPERGQELELGFDAGFLNDRAGLEFTLYRQRTLDAIVLSRIAPSTGYSEPRYVNVGELRNFGFEAVLRAQPVVRRNVAWETTFSLARNDSEVVDLGGADQMHVGFGVMHKVGYPIAGWHHFRAVDAQFNMTDGNITDPLTGATVGPHGVIRGSMMCDDGQGGQTQCFNALGEIIAPRVFLGRSEPLHEGALSSSVTLFGNWRLYGLVDFKTGFKKWDHVLRVRCSLNNNCLESRQTTGGTAAAGTHGFVDPSIPQSEQFQNDPSYRAMLASYQQADLFGDTWINDSSFWRLRELSLSYTVPGTLAQRFRASRATITMAGRNLHTWTDWTGLDPEARFLGGARGLFGGLEQNHLPQPTSFVTSVNLTF